MQEPLRFAVLHGPNLNRLGRRDPARYGRQTLAEVDTGLQRLAADLGVQLDTLQSNHEGVLVDWLHERIDRPGALHGIVINPASLTPYGRSLAQTVGESGRPLAVVHISSVYRQAKPGRADLFAEVADVVITGMGTKGYGVALQHLAETVRAASRTTSETTARTFP